MDEQNTENALVFKPHRDDPEDMSRISEAQGSFEWQVDLWTLLFDIKDRWIRDVVGADLPGGTFCDSIFGAVTDGPQRRVTFRLNRVEDAAGRLTNDRLTVAVLLEALRLLATPLREAIERPDGTSSASLRLEELLDALALALHPLRDAAWDQVKSRYWEVRPLTGVSS